jgi:polyphenol oxidase
MAQILFTGRSGGVSRQEFLSLNLGDHVGDSLGDVYANRGIVNRALSQKTPLYMNQVHGDNVVEVDSNTQFPVTADAMVTRERGLPLVVLTADCLPILISGEFSVAAIHAGRRGVMNGIIGKTISLMKNFGESKFIATIGPAICRDCYEVDLKMYQEVVKNFPLMATSDSQHCLDLARESSSQLDSAGVQVKQINVCCFEESNYFSYRREGRTGRGAGVVVL